MARVFSAIDVEDEKVLDRLERIQQKVDLGFNKVDREKMHITLEFFEDINTGELQKVKKSLKTLELDSFQADLKGLGAFPSTDYIRVIWVGAKSQKIHELYKQVSQHSVEADNKHEFQPHITLARVKNLTPDRKRKLQKTLEEFSEHQFTKIEVNKVKLFESELTSTGSKYRLIDKKDL